jgi:hypothetical protein
MSHYVTIGIPSEFPWILLNREGWIELKALHVSPSDLAGSVWNKSRLTWFSLWSTINDIKSEKISVAFVHNADRSSQEMLIGFSRAWKV